MGETFLFKLGEMYNEENLGYGTIFHAELKLNEDGEQYYYITWEDEHFTGDAIYSVAQAKNAIEEGYWVVC